MEITELVYFKNTNKVGYKRKYTLLKEPLGTFVLKYNTEGSIIYIQREEMQKKKIFCKGRLLC